MNRPTLSIPSAAVKPVDSAQHWVWSQSWLDMLFLHWRVPSELLIEHVAGDLTIDEFAGDAWVSLVIFRLKVRPTWLPYLPVYSNLLEVNLRTYVRCRDRPGITFLSVHAHNRLAIFLGRRLTPMPYQWAAMNYRRTGNDFQFDATDRASGGFHMSLGFHAVGAAAQAGENTLDEWLLERYRLFLPGRGRRTFWAEVVHPRWQIQAVDVSMAENSAGSRFCLGLARTADLAHFSPGVQARFGAFAALD